MRTAGWSLLLGIFIDNLATYPIEMSSFLTSLWLEGPLLMSTRCSSCFSTSRKRTVFVSSSQKGASPREQFSSMYG